MRSMHIWLRSRHLQSRGQAVLAVASPITGDQVTLTNHTWTFSSEALRRHAGLRRLRVINDFAAAATASQWKMSEKSAASTKNSFAGVVPRINVRPSNVRRSNRKHPCLNKIDRGNFVALSEKHLISSERSSCERFLVRTVREHRNACASPLGNCGRA
jgi:hypothetical protein